MQQILTLLFIVACYGVGWYEMYLLGYQRGRKFQSDADRDTVEDFKREVDRIFEAARHPGSKPTYIDRQ